MTTKPKKPVSIDATLKKIAGGQQAEPLAPGEQPPASSMAGEPACPICHGLGYLRRDLPVGHPEFGRLQICSCRQPQVIARVHQRLFAMSNLDALAHMTFDNFQPHGAQGIAEAEQDSVNTAYNTALRFAQSPTGWLLFIGTYGCGKTHLAAAIANYAVRIGVPTLFLTVPDLLDMLRFSYDDPTSTFEQRFEEIRSSPLLILDDFGTHNATNWAQEKLFQIVNHRYINHLPLVVTTNLALDQIEPRIRSRLQDSELVTRLPMVNPDHRNPAGGGARPDLSSLHLYKDQTFDSWSPRSDEELDAGDLASLERAYKAAQKFANKPSGWFLLTGESGCGKTHLAAAIANHCKDNRKISSPPLFINVPDLLDQLRATFSPGVSNSTTLDRRLDEFRSAQLLILDDLGAQSVSPWGQEKLYQVINYRYIAKLPTVFTTSMFLEEMKAWNSRLFTRIFDARLTKIIAITAPAFQVKTRKTTKRK